MIGDTKCPQVSTRGVFLIDGHRKSGHRLKITQILVLTSVISFGSEYVPTVMFTL